MGQLWSRRQALDPGQVKILKALYDNKKRGLLECRTPVVYKLSSDTAGQLGYGRLYGSSGSLETLQRDIRGALCAGLYTDVDIVNCHPTLVVQMAERLFGQAMPALAHYVEHREAFYESHAALKPEELKELVLRALYNGRLDESVPDAVHAIAREVASFRLALKQLPQHAELWAYCDRVKSNRNGSFLSYVVQTEERRCLEAMVAFFQGQSLSVDVLAYDGCMTRGVDNVTEAMLEACEQAVLDATSWRVRLKIKPMEALEDLGPADAAERAYAEMKAAWEVDHFYFRPNNTIVEHQANGSLCAFSLEHADTAFIGWALPEERPGQPNYFVRRWIRDAQRRTVLSLVFKSPEACALGELSLFRGYQYKALPHCDNPRAVAVFMDVLSAVCDDDEDTAAYLLRWLARIIQDPFHKSGVCPLLINRHQGTGKDTLCLWMKRIMGSHVAHYKEDEQLFEKHDTAKEGAVLVYLEEVGSGVCKAKAEALKAKITSDFVTVNPKGQRCYEVPNVANFIMTTNKTDPVTIEDADRRFFPIVGSARLLGKSAFWEELYSASKIDCGPGADDWIYPVGMYLESLDLSGFCVRRLPRNEMRSDMMAIAKAPVQQFLEQWVGEDVPAADLFEAYSVFCQTKRLFSGTRSSSGFGMLLMRYREMYRKRQSPAGALYSSM